MKYKVLIDYKDDRYCPPSWDKPIELKAGDIVDVISVEAAGSGRYIADRNDPMYRGHYLTTHTVNDDPYIYMMDFELLNLIVE